jgi:hypothetical protein
MFAKCDTCKDWGIKSAFFQSEESLRGLLRSDDYGSHSPSLKAADADLYDGVVAYKYFWNPGDIDIIIGSQNIASFAKCFCWECIHYSLALIPHYGDGAYCTFNEGLKDAPPRVIHSHGVDIRTMNYRAVFKIINSCGFRVIEGTAGVTRSIPGTQGMYQNRVVLANLDSIQLLGFQKWNGSFWEDLAI